MDVGIAVEVLGVGDLVDERVGGDEAAEDGVVDAPVHVDEINLVDHFVTGEASGRLRGEDVRDVVGSVRVAALAPGVIRRGARRRRRPHW